jgi:hypothetical protein
MPIPLNTRETKVQKKTRETKPRSMEYEEDSFDCKSICRLGYIR